MKNLENKNPATNDGWTPLHCAAREGDFETCKLFLENIEDKMPKTQDGKYPAMLALENDHFELSLLLIKSHVNPVKKRKKNNNGNR